MYLANCKCTPTFTDAVGLSKRVVIETNNLPIVLNIALRLKAVS